MKKEWTVGEIFLKASAIAATAVALYYIISLDNIDSVWQYSVCFLCLVYLIIILCTKWDAIVKFAKEEEKNTDIVDPEKEERDTRWR